MIEVQLVGTSGTVPLPYRFLTSLWVRFDGTGVLIDCGEGTQIALAAQKIALNTIDTICFTHYHADHTAGLPGLLLTMAKQERQRPITIIGPKGLSDLLTATQLLAKYIPFEIQAIEYSDLSYQHQIGQMELEAFRLQHSVPCYGYRFHYRRQPQFDVQKARLNQVPLALWGKLQKGATIVEDGRTFTPDMVLGNPRKGICFVYSTDTRPIALLEEKVTHADLWIAEGMYGDLEKQENAIEHKHMMMQEAAMIAKNQQVAELWFTHYSPSIVDPSQYIEQIHQIFENSYMGYDGKHTVFTFKQKQQD